MVISQEVKVSVCISIYNGERFIRKCLDSVVCQTLKEIEIVLVNNGSTDLSLEIMNEYKEIYPNIIKEIRGRGLLIGIQLHTDQVKFIKKLMENKLLTIRASENVVRILPPLNVKKNEIDQALKIIKKVCLEIN